MADRQTDRQTTEGAKDFIGCCPTNVECPIRKAFLLAFFVKL